MDADDGGAAGGGADALLLYATQQHAAGGGADALLLHATQQHAAELADALRRCQAVGSRAAPACAARPRLRLLPALELQRARRCRARATQRRCSQTRRKRARR
jgi:hypothetical protein